MKIEDGLNCDCHNHEHQVCDACQIVDKNNPKEGKPDSDMILCEQVKELREDIKKLKNYVRKNYVQTWRIEMLEDQVASFKGDDKVEDSPCKDSKFKSVTVKVRIGTRPVGKGLYAKDRYEQFYYFYDLNERQKVANLLKPQYSGVELNSIIDSFLDNLSMPAVNGDVTLFGEPFCNLILEVV